MQKDTNGATQKKISEYLHYYLGQFCDVPGHKIAKLVGFAYRNGENWPTVEDYKNDKPHGAYYTVNWEVIKPILRKLTTLSEDELTECVFLSFGSSNRDITATQISKVVKHPDQIKRITKWGGSLPFIAYSADGNPQLIGTIDRQSLNPEQFHYLLSLGIDLFGLITSSLSIDKETLK